ncbi:hypothetical protein V6582_21150 (plasmid) [Agrobacterium vitis]|uniref:hypothetical protein n=1 Tax=Agrobacterium vitis TaxID=373 RepID=UPI001F463D1C|nr:hypothetical protein [Agrobacterium vitis]
MSFSKAQDLIRLARLAATRRVGISLDEICKEFTVSHRTAQRMTDALETVFANVEAIDGEDISAAERRRLAWHLPDDFSSLPFSKREEIIEWVRRVIISGSTDYRRYQAAAIKQRYAIRFPGVTYGGAALSPRSQITPESRTHNTQALEDPDLLSGVVDAPPRLAMEMADLIRFKTSTLTAIGFQRNGVWGEETASQKVEHLGLMFGALAASPAGVVKGRGVPLSQLTFGLLIFPGVWDWYLQWREQRRGFYTKWEEDMLMVAQALTRAEVGWIRQHPELLKKVQPIEGLIAPEEIDFAARDWHGACDAFHRHAANRSKEIQRVMRVHRDPFEPIMVSLVIESLAQSNNGAIQLPVALAEPTHLINECIMEAGRIIGCFEQWFRKRTNRFRLGLSWH